MIKSTIKVNLNKNSYPIFLGENHIDIACEIISNLGEFSKIIIITDKNVGKLYLNRIVNSFASKNLNPESIVLPDGEKTKSFFYLKMLIERILKKRIDRNAILIALGGGVIGDLVGLAASLILRGIEYVQIPTTLLAQVDSSVGGKTAINSQFGKNLIGTFKQPKAVISSLNTLKTLDKRDINAGYAEIFKYALIKDKKFFDWLLINGSKVIKLKTSECTYAIEKSCKIKSKIVAEDEKEKGVRALLNLGHTFGHSLESINNYSKKINHGEAVLVGICMALKFSYFMKICKENYFQICEKHFKENNLKYLLNHFKIKTSAKELLKHMEFDKKTKNGTLNFILVSQIGKASIFGLNNKRKVLNFLEKEYF